MRREERRRARRQVDQQHVPDHTPLRRDVRQPAASPRRPPWVIEEVRPDVAHVHHLTCLSTRIHQRARPARHSGLLHAARLLADLPSRPAAGPANAALRRSRRLMAAATARASKVGAAIAYDGRTSVEPAWSATARGNRAPAADVGGSGRPPTRDTGSCQRGLAPPSEAYARAVSSADVSTALAPSSHLRDCFIAAGFDAGRIQLWPYGTHLEARASMPREGSTLRLVFLGSLMASKAPDLAMDAAHRLPPGRAPARIRGASRLSRGRRVPRGHRGEAIDGRRHNLGPGRSQADWRRAGETATRSCLPSIRKRTALS